MRPEATCQYWDPSDCEGTEHCPSRCPRFVDTTGSVWTVRPYAPSDREALLEMYREFDSDDRAQGLPPLTEERRVEWIDTLVADGGNFVATADGEIAGHAVYMPTHDPEPELAVFVHQEYQSRGLGTELCKHVIADASAAGRDALVLEVEPSNRHAIGMYERLGFERVEAGGSRSRIDRRAPSFQMRLELSSPSALTTRHPPLVRG
ncbi:GNAT family N-acetyltransferase [Natranaeroarchaeum aerophilus]|uniref:GNAT family N-acetyltransferase n=1 Tax=Natranaeroarchaeum aerophilus TaxID=2917711 RepID=A0AAE3FQE9_9EURY|nr:GNAT family N-acetyltransferase [Natranaeroarchaeum aerophilus]MCL9812734.1 GNAT family N-acetyltransferase [Natranaeroarchaeum aerophilus]